MNWGTSEIYYGKHVLAQVYHSIPPGWDPVGIQNMCAALGGKVDLMHDRQGGEMLGHQLPYTLARRMLYRVAEEAQSEPACAEIAIRYIELNFCRSYSGFIRSRMSRKLKRAALTDQQKARLHSFFSQLVRTEDWSMEFYEYAKLWRIVATKDQLVEFVAELRLLPNGQQRAEWLLKKLGLAEK